jgi:thiol-disulfide isomerase/thioredoxin
LADRGNAITYGDLSELRLVLPPLPVPESFNAMTMEGKAKWGQAYMQSPEGKKLNRNNVKRGRFPVTVRGDGSFSVDDLGPGTYSLSVRGIDTSKKTNDSLGEEVVKGETMFVIPENIAGKQFDVGELALESLFNLQVGKEVPDPELKTLDGKPLKLSDHRGKVVLLDFWATWCGPCVGDTPNLKAVHEAFGKDERFVLVSLSLDPDAQPAIDYVKKNDLGWVHGFLGDWGKTKVLGQFGVRGIPAYFLIGPDGKLISKDVNGNSMKREVEAALAKLPASRK